MARLSGEVEADESNFGGVRNGKQGGGATVKIDVFPLLKWKGLHGHHPQCENRNCLLLMDQRETGATRQCGVQTALRRSNALDVSDFHHRGLTTPTYLQKRETTSMELITSEEPGEASFRRRFNGIKSENFYCFLKECEWRFNGGSHQMLLKYFKHWVKCSSH